jgi:succinate dehydrogenase/fumarate reductase flavoprotein subunit
MKGSLSRRGFLKAVGVATVGAAATGALAGCSDDTSAEAKPIDSNIPTAWDLEYDVVCVGSGTGMSAAIEAKRAGRSIVVLEKMPYFGGITTAAGGGSFFGGNNSLQKANGIEDNNDAWFFDEMLFTENRANPDIIRTLVDMGADTYEWLTDLGLNLTLSSGAAFPWSINRRMMAGPGDTYTGDQGLAWTQVLHNELQNLGVEILKEHRLIELYRESNGGPVVGCRVETPAGTINVKANQAIILSTGGWAGSEFLLDKYDRRSMGEDTSCTGYVKALDQYIVENTGDAHIAAQNIGGMLQDMSGGTFYYILLGCDQYYNWGPFPIDYETQTATKNNKRGIPRDNDTYARCILVNKEGRRYIDESYGTQKGNICGNITENEDLIFNQKFLTMGEGRQAWLVGDANAAAELKWPIDELNNPEPLKGFCLSPEYIAVADTLEALASKMNVAAAGLVETVQTYNGYVDTGTDEDFGKKKMTGKIEQAPYYAMRLVLVRHCNHSGLRVNTKMQVIENWDATLSPDGHVIPSIDQEPVIPHLYATGQTANLVPYRREHNVLGFYVSSGRIAGKSAAQETPAGELSK